jgi:hypothetical protein
MMPSPSIHHSSDARHSCWLSAGSAQARIGSLDSPAVALPILSFTAQSARSHRRAHPRFAANRSHQPLQSKLGTPGLVANPHSARRTAAAPPTAISCLGAFPTPATTARQCLRYRQRPKTCTGRDITFGTAVDSRLLASRMRFPVETTSDRAAEYFCRFAF